MEISEEQRRRNEENRLIFGEKRKIPFDYLENLQRPQDFRLAKCRKLDGDNDVYLQEGNGSYESESGMRNTVPEKFRVRLEICSPDSFSVTPSKKQGFQYPDEQNCLEKLSEILYGAIPSHYTQNHDGGKAGVYKIRDYSMVSGCLKRSKIVEVEEIPWITFSVVEKLSHSYVSGKWEPCKPEHFTEEKVEEMIRNLPSKLVNSLLPFQLDGLRFGLRRGGRCLIADEMGLGKTLQAIAIAGCFISEGSILVVCPAVLRFSWAEELERWLPFCLPSDIHLVFGHHDNPANLPRWPKVVVISYTMLQRLRKTMLEQDWALMIVDESHHLRCSKKKSEPLEIKAVLDIAEKVKRIVLLTGTPSLSRPFDIFHQINILWPGLLGKDKYEFAKTYCEVGLVKTMEGKIYQDFSKGTRLQELNILLNQTVMIRRLKQHVLTQLPPKRRQIVTILLKKSDIDLAMAVVSDANQKANEQNAAITEVTDHSHEPEGIAQKARGSNNIGHVNDEDFDVPDSHKDNQLCGKLSYHQLGVAKLSAFRQWLSLHPLTSRSDYTPEEIAEDTSSTKMVIFAHHHKVLDGIQEFICDKGIEFVRIDGRTLPRDRQLAVQSFKFSSEVKVAIIGVEAGGVGLDFSAAQNVVFLELPKTPSLLLQAEDRAHRRGQTSSVNVYIFCAKDTMDESNWQNLNKKLYRNTSTTDGKYDAKTQIDVERVHSFNPAEESSEREVQPLKANNIVADKIVESCVDLGSEIDVIDTIDLKDDMIPHFPFIENGPEERYSDISSTMIDQENQENDQAKKHLADGHLKEDDSNSFFALVDSLRFEVSQNTGRIHLYSCTPGKDPRPRPYFQNFRPEEIEATNSSPGVIKENSHESIMDDPVYVRAILEFMKEWSSLRPIEKRKLLGKPLQLPLSLELSYLSESISHNSEGLLRGGSKRRNTPLSQISVPLPTDAVWKKVNLRSGYQRKEKEYTQAWSMSDEPLCKLCQKPCKGNNSKEPEYFEDLFCDLACYENYRTRTSSGYIRQELFQIEHGVCTNCKLDCHQLVVRVRILPLEKRRRYISQVAPELFARKNLLETLVNDPTEGNAWHADHIIPVYRGGGECRLENMRTLCVACHADVTAAQCAERKLIRSKAKKQLKDALRKNKTNQNQTKEKDCLVSVSDEEEDELLIEVPGSSYSVIDRKTSSSSIIN